MSQTYLTYALAAGLFLAGLHSAAQYEYSEGARCEILSRGLSRPAVRDNVKTGIPSVELDLAYVYSDFPQTTAPATAGPTTERSVAALPTRSSRRTLASLPHVSDKLRAALLAQRELLSRQPRGKRYKIGDRTLRPGDFIAVIDQLLNGEGLGPLPDVLPVARRGEVHFTAYYTPELQASPVRTERFRFPLLEVPSGGKRDGMPTRKEVESSPDITERFKALAWVENPLDVHTIQLQGSGFVNFPDGSRQYLAYGCSNGHPFRGLLHAIHEARPETSAMSMREIRDYIAADLPGRSELTWLNPSYVFFRKGEPTPKGSLGIALTPMISVAADPAHYPPGAVLLAEVPRPGHSGRTETRVLLVQDQGSAIKGRARIDLYTGVGSEALDIARVISEAGEVFVLAPPLPQA